ncbi:hypothetical protein [Lysinibacter cavernae]|uniref:Flagellar biosynthesis/type III secretory pathway M-ring protein FliF/YscJ n=1 Tax=Lysinibacter cavernae TaxID=1640652 RepID=A0A7X5R2L3_9MICO|nr:hypothetical protein [Lysinibacter cavernae]NIH54272.1 flagellar biosynthesis/type III secretory pathway M-ring protein FliF/YscJ [Lysinibacter cavernae]
MSDTLLAAIWAITPTLALGVLFWFVIRSIIRSDRNERAAYNKIEAEERAKRGLPPRSAKAPAEGDQQVTPPGSSSPHAV